MYAGNTMPSCLIVPDGAARGENCWQENVSVCAFSVQSSQQQRLSFLIANVHTVMFRPMPSEYAYSRGVPDWQMLPFCHCDCSWVDVILCDAGYHCCYHQLWCFSAAYQDCLSSGYCWTDYDHQTIIEQAMIDLTMIDQVLIHHTMIDELIIDQTMIY